MSNDSLELRNKQLVKDIEEQNHIEGARSYAAVHNEDVNQNPTTKYFKLFLLLQFHDRRWTDAAANEKGKALRGKIIHRVSNYKGWALFAYIWHTTMAYYCTLMCLTCDLWGVSVTISTRHWIQLLLQRKVTTATGGTINNSDKNDNYKYTSFTFL